LKESETVAIYTEFAPHETIIVHEALRATALGLATMERMKPVVQHPDLNQVLDKAIRNKEKELRELKQWAQNIIS